MDLQTRSGNLIPVLSSYQGQKLRLVRLCLQGPYISFMSNVKLSLGEPHVEMRKYVVFLDIGRAGSWIVTTLELLLQSLGRNFVRLFLT